jgi:transcriptional regulator with XRE-family HTH domain
MEKDRFLDWALANILKETRKAKGLTQGSLADCAGLSAIYLSRLECGEKNASVNALVRLASALDIKPSEFMRRVEEAVADGPSAPQRKQGRPGRKGREEG